MALDLFFRATTKAKIIAWLTTPQVRATIGDLRARDDEGNVVSPRALKEIPGNVYLSIWEPNTIIDVPSITDEKGIITTPPVMDPFAWIHVRLDGDTEQNDFSGPPMSTGEDRWEHSRMVNLISIGGTTSSYRDVVTFRNNTGVEIFRGSEMETNMKFHEYEGGNSY